jgi:hypothetical protein
MLTFIFNAETFTISRNPSFGNAYRSNYNVMVKESRGRNLIVAPNSTYSFKKKFKTLSISLDYLTQAEGQGLITFLKKCLGKDIGFTDHESITYTAIFISPEISLTQNDRANYNVKFELLIVE